MENQEQFDFYNFPREPLARFLGDRFGYTTYRSDQIFRWVYRSGVCDFGVMSNLSADSRATLKEVFTFPETKVVERQISVDGSRKYVFELDPKSRVESVMIKQPTRMTLCVSSQVGCGMGCTFCRTGEMGFRRNLTTSEIIRQVLGVLADAKNFGDSFQNIVFMGMGEPLHNFKNVTEALKILLDQHGLSVPGRKITVSSVGLVPAIKKFGELGLDVNLAVSLNATTDEVRSQIMPINKRFPLKVLLDCLRQYPLRARRAITIEYVLLAGVNDSPDDLKRLPRLLSGIRCKVNLIPYNSNAGLGFEPPGRQQIMKWQDSLVKNGIDTTIRWSKGQDINAACGQLATQVDFDAQAIEQ